MTAGPEITSAAGLRRVQVFALDANGYPDGDQSGANGYEGRSVRGIQSMSLTIPPMRRIVHRGQDRVIAQDYLPPEEAASGEFRAAAQDLGFDAMLTNTLLDEVAEVTLGGLATDQQGNEIDVCLVVYRQALDTTPGAQQLRRWQHYIFPIARMVPRPGGADQGGADENIYDLIPAVASKTPWGTAFTLVDNGFTETQVLRGSGEYPAMIERFDASGSPDTFNLSWTPISVAKTAVFASGVAKTVSSVDVNAKTVTLSTPLADGPVVAVYQTSDPI
ncbi:MAG: hypothetical protein BroJett042_31270 [Bacteroidota bacterium]|nr:MAG: hypothetical protein BroJett042_31270 [Bacteroidota bacterium]